MLPGNYIGSDTILAVVEKDDHALRILRFARIEFKVFEIGKKGALDIILGSLLKFFDVRLVLTQFS